MFEVWLLERVTVPSAAWVLDTFRLSPLETSFLSSCLLPLCVRWSVMHHFPCRPLQSPLCGALSSFLPCSADSPPWSEWTSQSISLTQGFQEVRTGFPFPPPIPRVEIFLKAVSWGNFRVQLICFPSLRDHFIDWYQGFGKHFSIHVEVLVQPGCAGETVRGDLVPLLYLAHFAPFLVQKVNPIPIPVVRLD